MVNITGQLDTMWIGIFHDQTLAAIALIAVIIILCYRRGLEPHQSFLVLLPTVVGLMSDNSIPDSVRNLMLMGAGLIIGYGFVKIFIK